jgi:hypothetical protein
MIDDCGTLIDMNNRNTYDYVSDIVTLLNELNEENKQLKKRLIIAEDKIKGLMK